MLTIYSIFRDHRTRPRHRRHKFGDEATDILSCIRSDEAAHTSVDLQHVSYSGRPFQRVNLPPDNETIAERNRIQSATHRASHRYTFHPQSHIISPGGEPATIRPPILAFVASLTGRAFFSHYRDDHSSIGLVLAIFGSCAVDGDSLRRGHRAVPLPAFVRRSRNLWRSDISGRTTAGNAQNSQIARVARARRRKRPECRTRLGFHPDTETFRDQAIQSPPGRRRQRGPGSGQRRLNAQEI